MQARHMFGYVSVSGLATGFSHGGRLGNAISQKPSTPILKFYAQVELEG